MRSTIRYRDLEEDIFNLLDNSISTSQIQRKLLKIHEGIHLQTILSRLDELYKNEKVDRGNFGNIIIWKKK